MNKMHNRKILSFVCFLLASISATAAGGGNVLPEVVEALARMPKAHPRLMVRGMDEFGRLNARAKEDPDMAWLRRITLKSAEAWLSKPPKRGMNGMRMTGEAEFSESVVALAMAYRLTGERRYAEKCRDYMLQVCDWPDWNPKHYLDVADMLLGMSIGYDWVFDALLAEERKTIRTAILEKGFNTRNVEGWWKGTSNNWAQVCWGAIVMAAVAIGDEEPEQAREVISEMLRSINASLAVYAPNGAYPEGPGYWGYGTGRFCFMLAALESALGTDFGLFGRPGLSTTGDFIDAMTGPTGRFWNIADGHWVRKVRVCDAYLAQRTGRRGILAFDIAKIRDYRKGYGEKDEMRFLGRVFDEYIPLLMLWGDFRPVDATNAGPLDYASGGRNPVVIMRSSRDENAAYLGLKGGRSFVNHGHMDQGAVQWESDAYCWAMDIGPQDYTALEKAGIELWNLNQNGDRWKIFRMNNMSHNLVTVDSRPFCVTGFCDFVSTSFKPDVASATLDLSPAVRPYATRGSRRCTLDRKTRIGTVEDTLDGLAPGAKVRWAIVTAAPYLRVRGNDVVLESEDGRTLTLRCEQPVKMTWTPLDMGYRVNPWDNNNGGWTQVTFSETAGADGMFRSRVKFIPGPTTGQILPDEKVSLKIQVGRNSPAFDRVYDFKEKDFAIPETVLSEARTNAVKRVLFADGGRLPWGLRRLTTTNVQKMRTAGLEVFISFHHNRATAVRFAALLGADGVCVEKVDGLNADGRELKSASVDFIYVK